MARLEHLNLADSDDGSLAVAEFDDGGIGHAVLRLPDVRYCPQSRCSVVGGVVPGEIIDHDEHAAQAIAAYAKAGRRLFGRAEADSSPKEVCILGNPHSHVFFHWLGELLKVVALESAGFTGSYVLAPGMPPVCAEFLALLGIGAERIERPVRETRYSAVWVCGHLNLFTVGDHPGALHALRERLRRAGEAAPRRLWIDRRGVARGVVNTAEIAPLLESAGFTVVDMAAVSAREQVALASGAEVIAGPHGSGMAHAALMTERGAVIEAFSPLHLYPCMTETCRVLGHRYAMLSGTNAPWQGYPHGDGVHVDPAQLALALGSL